MKKQLNVKEIESQIGYDFEDKVDLLYQAFTKDSYALENGVESNQVLEFIGDRVLDFYVTKILAKNFGYIRSEKEEHFNINEEYDDFVTIDGLNEADLTEIKKNLVDNKNLSKIIDDWGFTKYLSMGKGDIKGHAENQVKVKADIFEAILGAVAIASNWNNEKLESTVAYMLNLGSGLLEKINKKENYVSLVQHWWQVHIGGNPEYSMTESFDPLRGLFNYDETKYYIAEISIVMNNYSHLFKGSGKTKQDARFECAKNLYKHLVKNDLLESIRDVCPSQKELTKDIAINVLQELAQKGWTSMPEYDFDDEPEYDENGNAFWWCQCDVRSHNVCYRVSRSSKKEAKKCAAYLCICKIMGYEDKYSKNN